MAVAENRPVKWEPGVTCVVAGKEREKKTGKSDFRFAVNDRGLQPQSQRLNDSLIAGEPGGSCIAPVQRGGRPAGRLRVAFRSISPFNRFF